MKVKENKNASKNDKFRITRMRLYKNNIIKNKV